MNSPKPSAIYSVNYDSDFDKQIRRLPKFIVERIHFELTFISTTGSLKRLKLLKGNLKGYQSIKFGDYRLIVEINEDEKIIQVHRVGHRREIYRWK